MPRGPQPGCIIQRAAPDADYTIPRHAANPGAALRANQSGVDASANGGALRLTRLKAKEDLVEPTAHYRGSTSWERVTSKLSRGAREPRYD
jgi:hypothetical protein